MKTMKVIDHPSILSASPIKIVEGLMPHRVVLRQEGNDFITHCENLTPVQEGDTLEWRHRDFYWGHYFQNKDDAVKDFEERSNK